TRSALSLDVGSSAGRRCRPKYLLRVRSNAVPSVHAPDASASSEISVDVRIRSTVRKGKKGKNEWEARQLISLKTIWNNLPYCGRRWVVPGNGTRMAPIDMVNGRHDYLPEINSWARSLCSASSRRCCRCRKWCRMVDNRVGALAEGRGSNEGRLVAGLV